MPGACHLSPTPEDHLRETPPPFQFHSVWSDVGCMRCARCSHGSGRRTTICHNLWHRLCCMKWHGGIPYPGTSLLAGTRPLAVVLHMRSPRCPDHRLLAPHGCRPCSHCCRNPNQRSKSRLQSLLHPQPLLYLAAGQQPHQRGPALHHPAPARKQHLLSSCHCSQPGRGSDPSPRRTFPLRTGAGAR